MLGYRPNAIASILSRRKSDIVALVISDLRNPYYPPLLEKLSRGLQQLGQQSLLFNITPGVDVKQQLMALRQYNVDALVIVSATILSGEELNLAAEGRRAVLVNRIAPDTTLTSVICDNAAGARAIADHFYELGHRRAAFVAGLPNTMVSRERQHSFIARLAELGMTLSACTGGGDYSYEAGYRSALEIARRGSTDAIFFANDILAIGGIDALREEAGCVFPTTSPSLASTTSRWRLGRAMGSRLTASRSTPSSRRHCSSSLHQRRRSQTHRGIICSRENS